MRIQEMNIENFRKFETQHFKFHPQFTVIIGNNATGKTSILDALSILMGTYLLDFEIVTGERRTATIYPNEIRRLFVDKAGIPSPVYQENVSLSCKGFIHNQPYGDNENNLWARKIVPEFKSMSRTFAKNVIALGREDHGKVKRGENFTLPLLAYYGTGRLWKQKRNLKSQVEIEANSPLMGYRDCLDPASNQHLLKKWFKQYTVAQAGKREPIQQLEAMRQAVIDTIDECEEFYYDVTYDEMVVKFIDRDYSFYSDMSDGYRNMLGMVADIAHRAARLNPHLGGNVVRETPGIVLIDEIDQHLHPKWQRNVVDDLKRVFPNIQFIATTHSPFIIQSMNRGEVLDLNSMVDVRIEGQNSEPAPSFAYEDKSIEDIVEDIMGIKLPQISKRKQDMLNTAKEYYRVLQEASNAEISNEMKEQLKTKLDELSLPYSDNVAYHAFLEIERLAVGLGTSGQRRDSNNATN